MAEEAQELTVTVAGQVRVDLIPATTPVEVAQLLTVSVATTVSVDIVPASD
jgi:hypothetical protein